MIVQAKTGKYKHYVDVYQILSVICTEVTSERVTCAVLFKNADRPVTLYIPLEEYDRLLQAAEAVDTGVVQ